MGGGTTRGVGGQRKWDGGDKDDDGGSSGDCLTSNTITGGNLVEFSMKASFIQGAVTILGNLEGGISFAKNATLKYINCLDIGSSTLKTAAQCESVDRTPCISVIVLHTLFPSNILYFDHIFYKPKVQ